MATKKENNLSDSLPALLRAARDIDEYELNNIFKKIAVDGIEPEILNIQDSSGRTALSYICGNINLIYYLDNLLKLPGLDINKADNEGNTPIHFAAQSGQIDIINMLITRSRSLKIDPKNVWGMTPLMKAALQGRTRCAKLLLFAGASTTDTDFGRKFNAIQWARLTGRESCAEMLESVSKARQQSEKKSILRPQINNKLKIVRSPSNNTNVKRSDSFISKINKLIPFKNSKSNSKTNSKTNSKSNSKKSNDNYNINKSSSLSAVTGKTQLTDFLTSISVPKLIVTQQYNSEFIRNSWSDERQTSRI